MSTREEDDVQIALGLKRKCKKCGKAFTPSPLDLPLKEGITICWDCIIDTMLKENRWRTEEEGRQQKVDERENVETEKITRRLLKEIFERTYES